MTFSPFIKINGVHPDLVLILIIGWTTLRGWDDGLIWGAVGGLSLDLLSAAPFGLFSFTSLLVAFVAGSAHRLNFGSSIVVPVVLTFPLTFLFNGVALFILNVLGRPIFWGIAISNVLTPVAIFNTGLMILIFPLLYLLNRWLYPQTLSF